MEKIYPLHPDFITESTDGDENTMGIISKEHLIGIITEHASHLKNPVTIVEFLPQNRINRIDSMSIHYDLHPPCRAFRKDFNCEKYCIFNDNLHAEIFRNLENKSLEQELNKIIKNPQSDYYRNFRLTYSRNPIINVGKKDIENQQQIFIFYECPILGYRELIFPIIIEGKILGVLFVGELVLEQNLKLIESIRTKFIAKKIFEFPSLIKSIEKSHNKWIKDKNNILTNQKYESILNDILILKRKLEKRLEDILIEKKVKYINEKIGLLNQIISYNFSDSQDSGLMNFWEKTNQLINKLSLFFPVDFMCVFGTKEYSSKPPEKLMIQAQYDSGNILPQGAQYDISIVPKEFRKSPTSSVECPIILKGLVLENESYMVDSNNDLIRIIPTVKNPQAFLIIWVRYNNQKWARLKTKENHPIEFQAFTNAISGFYTLLAFKFSSLWAEIAQERLETNFRIMGHEIGQIIAMIDQRYWSPFSNYDFFKYLGKKGFKDLKDDFNGFLRQLAALKYNSQCLIDELNPKKKDFYIYDEILFKWRDTYKSFAQHKKIHIKVDVPIKDDPLRPMVFADLVLIEQIVYNLLRNALKYSYRGTNVWLDCSKESTSPDSPHILTVTSYGIPILKEDDERIYGLHERGNNTTQNDKNSQGIGLYLAKKIINAHKGAIYHTSKMLSAKYLPFFHPYLLHPAFIDHPKFSEIQNEFKQIKESDIYLKCCAMSSHGDPLFYPSFNEVSKKINTPIYETTFYVVIPPKLKTL
ncbi:MAG: ATP-binding protein [Bacteroidetes bacterium]|nr:ATP-binding protein [Bacteroidota bacterium]